MARRLKEERGVTLVELMFACSIMAVALSLLFGSMVTISLANRVTEGRGIASTQVSGVMEELRGSPATLLSYVPPPLVGAGSMEAIEVRCYDADGGTIVLPVDVDTFDGLLPNPVQVECTATWLDEKSRQFSLSASEWVYR